MRSRAKIIRSLERVYREAFEKAAESKDQTRMDRLDFGFQRDQVLLEVLLDVRGSLADLSRGEAPDEPSLLDKAMAIRDLTRLRPR